MGGFTKGGLNFDAKVRRASQQSDDLFYAHAAGMDAFARGLVVADALIRVGFFEDILENRYASFKSGIGREITEGRADFKSLEANILDKRDIPNESGRQEYIETILNEYILKA